MPNLTTLLKPSKKASTTSDKSTDNKVLRHNNNGFLSAEKPGRSRDKSPLHNRPSPGFFRRGKNARSNASSQSRIISSTSSMTSLVDSPSAPRIYRPDGQMPKCKTVANFQSPTAGCGISTQPGGLAPPKCSSVSSFGPLRRGGNSICASLASLGLSRAASVVSGSLARSRLLRSREGLSADLELCRLCLCDMPHSQMVSLKRCQCKFCHYCLQQYVRFEITGGNVSITCPDAYCEKAGLLTEEEIESLIDAQLYNKYRQYQLNYEVDLDPARTWCPRAGCETVCKVNIGETPSSVTCPQCGFSFCSGCKLQWHNNQTCDVYAKEKAKLHQTFDESLILSEDEDATIKRCPLCCVPIERDDGCAQMMCKRCKHVFCWYCLASLDDDFLLRHYDKGPCKNKLGHSRASVFWHRTQVVGIFAGFGLLLLVTCPFLLLVAPCIICSNCKSSTNNKDEDSTVSTATSI